MKKRTLFGTALILSGVLGGGTIAATQTAGESADGAASQGTATSDAATTQTNSQVKDAGTATVSSRQGAQVPATSTETSTTSGNRRRPGRWPHPPRCACPAWRQCSGDKGVPETKLISNRIGHKKEARHVVTLPFTVLYYRLFVLASATDRIRWFACFLARMCFSL